MSRMTDLEIAYTVDLLTRLSESIECYLDDDRSGIETVMLQEIKEAKRLYRKYYKRIALDEVQA